MPLVIDVSVMANWYFPDERNVTGDAILAMLNDDEEGARVPGIWWFEMQNVLLLGERRGRSTFSQTERFLVFLRDLPITIAPNPRPDVLLDLARRYNLSACDAAYLELAKREQIALATFDRALACTATAEGVALIGAA
jgi:predicted nucleic acid-binding protein